MDERVSKPVERRVADLDGAADVARLRAELLVAASGRICGAAR